MQQTAIQYIGHRPHYREACYGSGIEFEKDQTLLVPSDLANKLLRHPDVYRLGIEPEAKPAIIPKPNPDRVSDPEIENVRDTVKTMDHDALSEFSMTHYRIRIHPKQSVENARRKVLQLIDLYGIT